MSKGYTELQDISFFNKPVRSLSDILERGYQPQENAEAAEELLDVFEQECDIQAELITEDKAITASENDSLSE